MTFCVVKGSFWLPPVVSSEQHLFDTYVVNYFRTLPEFGFVGPPSTWLPGQKIGLCTSVHSATRSATWDFFCVLLVFVFQFTHLSATLRKLHVTYLYATHCIYHVFFPSPGWFIYGPCVEDTYLFLSQTNAAVAIHTCFFPFQRDWHSAIFLFFLVACKYIIPEARDNVTPRFANPKR